VCQECKGQRLRSDSLSVRVGGRGIAEYTSLPIEDSVEAFEQVKLNKREEQIAGPILREIKKPFEFPPHGWPRLPDT
jgi:excinuclease ABC subunit A